MKWQKCPWAHLSVQPSGLGRTDRPGPARPAPLLSLPLTRDRTLTLAALATRVAPPSPLDSGEIRRTWPPPWCAVDAPHDGGHSYPRRSDAGDLLLSTSTPFALVAWRGVPWRSRRHRRYRCRGAAVPDRGGAGGMAPPWLGLAWRCCALGVCRRGRHGRALRFTSPVSIHHLLLPQSALLTSLLIPFVLLSHWPASPC